jgi:ABC-type oligopeptide transport system substrate-binding subunit
MTLALNRRLLAALLLGGALAQAAMAQTGAVADAPKKVLKVAYRTAETGFDPSQTRICTRAPSRRTSSKRCTPTTTWPDRPRSSR